MVEIKICGMRRSEDIVAANVLLPDYVGFVFAKSRRKIRLQEAHRLRGALDKRVRAVGVFVNAPPHKVAETAILCRLSAVQLHGDENGEYVRALRRFLPGGCEVWKAANVKGAEDIRTAEKAGADRLLLDAFSHVARGGTGQRFDWGLIGDTVIDRPFFVAGGITSDNAAAAIRAAKNAGRPFGIDVSGSVETDGYKDFDKMREIIDVVRQQG